MSAGAVPTEGRLEVVQIRSAIGSKPKTRGTLRALGLRGIGHTNTLPDRAEIRGMLARVPHLVSVATVGPSGEIIDGTVEPSGQITESTIHNEQVPQ